MQGQLKTSNAQLTAASYARDQSQKNVSKSKDDLARVQRQLWNAKVELTTAHEACIKSQNDVAAMENGQADLQSRLDATGSALSSALVDRQSLMLVYNVQIEAIASLDGRLRSEKTFSRKYLMAAFMMEELGLQVDRDVVGDFLREEQPKPPTKREAERRGHVEGARKKSSFDGVHEMDGV